jgi:hypothetical protein
MSVSCAFKDPNLPLILYEQKQSEDWDAVARQDIFWRRPRETMPSIYLVMTWRPLHIALWLTVGLAILVSATGSATTTENRQESTTFHVSDNLHDLITPHGSSGLVLDLLPSRSSWWRSLTLSRDSEHAYCWNKKESKGLMSFTLKDPGSIHVVGIEYRPETLLAQPRRTLKTVRVWGEHVAHSHTEIHQKDTLEVRNEHWTERLFLLREIQYDVDASRPQQNFTITRQHNDELFSKVIFELISNWGDPQMTCAYALRVYGLPLIDS